MSPLDLVLILAGVSAGFAWLASLLTGDTSWVDREWSIVPAIYVWVFAGWAGLKDARLDVMAVLVTIWAVRLTFNFARKGGYMGVEDYRWGELRRSMKPWQFQLFNLGFIVIAQNALLVAITLPAWTAYQHQGGFGALDVIVALAFVASTALETVADEQQWRFQVTKHELIAQGHEPEAAFLTTGLFRSSRHPNYFFEQAQWWLVYVFGALAIGHVFTWTILGAVCLTGLFIGSTRFTEQLSLAKYPSYADYQRRTSMLIPWPPKRRTGLQAS